MNKPTSRMRYLRPPEVLSVNVPTQGDGATVSVRSLRSKNRASVGASLLKLHCRSRGCHERIADLEISTDRSDRGPTLRLAIHAPWVNESTTESDAAILAQIGRQPAGLGSVRRLRLTGAFDPEVSPVSMEFDHWRPGSHVEIVCRHGHVSEITPSALHAAARRASVAREAG